MTKYVKAHTKYMMEQIKSKNIMSDLLDYHHMQILHIQHERLVHLIVLCLFTLLLLGALALFFIFATILAGCLSAILLVVDVFYVRHYYLLENTVQKWYEIENYLIVNLKNIGTNSIDL